MDACFSSKLGGAPIQVACIAIRLQVALDGRRSKLLSQDERHACLSMARKYAKQLRLALNLIDAEQECEQATAWAKKANESLLDAYEQVAKTDWVTGN